MSSSSPAVSYTTHTTTSGVRIGVATLNHPPVNALGHPLRTGLSAALSSAAADSVSGLVLVAAGKTFPAGADIAEFATGKALSPPTLTDVIAELDAPSLPFLTVSCLHGTAFGGGLELALATHYRIAAPDAKIGLPEVGLGLLPGAGGTQRVPRITGIPQAVAFITQGRPMSAHKAAKLGLLDALLVPSEAASLDARTRAAIAYAEAQVAAHAASGVPASSSRRVSAWPVPGNPDLDLVAQAKAKVVAGSGGFLAPAVIVDAIAGVLQPSFEAGMEVEAECFMKLFTSSQARAMQAFFFAERAAPKVPGLDPRAARPIHTLGVIGAGTMGSGIAISALKAKAGLAVILVDVSQPALDAAADRISAYFASRVAKKRMTQENASSALGRISYSTEYAPLGTADLVVEAVFEKMALKQKIFASLDAVCKPDAVLASNTSTLDIDAIASATSRPQSVVGTHFFAPAHIMPLLENIRGSASGQAALATAMAFGKILGKKPILVGNCPGFVANRIFANYFTEASFLVEEGVQYTDVDRVARMFGLPLGPFQTADLSGLDIGAQIKAERGHIVHPDARSSSLADQLVALGRLGQKSGSGWYLYQNGSRKSTPDPDVHALVASHRATLPGSITSPASPHNDDSILLRLLLPVILEGLRCIEEGITSRASDIDVAAVYGYGWPRYTCGPMWWAENEMGWDEVLEAVQDLEGLWKGQPWLQPPHLLTVLADEDLTLRGWAKINKSKL